MSGKALRMKRFLNPSDGRMVIFPLDHGVSCGPVPGLERVADAARLGAREGADALVMHKGMLRFLENMEGRLPGIFMHLSAGTQLGPDDNRKVLAGTVEEAVRRGADGVSVHINLGDDHEAEMLRDLGTVGSACADWQMPLLVMVYIRGKRYPSPAPDCAIAHAARLAAELGADVIKIPAPCDMSVLAEITASLPVPVVIAGGSKTQNTGLFLERIEQALQAGARGVAVGRNVFQHERPGTLLNAIGGMVHERLKAETAWERLLKNSVCGGR